VTLDQPIIIDITEPASNPVGGLADVLIGALGLTGALALGAALLGVIVAGLLFWVRSRSR